MTWDVRCGPHKGAKTSRTTSQIPTLKNACGKVLAGLTAKTLVPDEDIDLDAYIGKTYFIVVVNTEKGGTRIDSVSPSPVA